MQEPLSGEVAMVTGGARRIGAEIARTLHAAGMHLIVHYRHSQQAAESLKAELHHRRPDSVTLVQADLGRLDDALPLLQRAVQSQGRLDLLVNNASRYFATPIKGTSEEQWQQLMGVNAKAPYFLSRALAEVLRASRGCIVNLTDIYGQRPIPNHAIYCMSKAALIMMTRALALDLAPEVRVNAISPGAILWAEDHTDTTRLDVIARTALKRTGKPEDIAAAVLYLKRDADFVSGQVLTVDGGRSVLA